MYVQHFCGESDRRLTLKREDGIITLTWTKEKDCQNARQRESGSASRVIVEFGVGGVEPSGSA
jgi:hypothetical protein